VLIAGTVKPELAKKYPAPTMPDIKINSDALSFLPHHFIDVKKYLPANFENLKMWSSIGTFRWNDEGQSYPVKNGDLQDGEQFKFVEMIPQGLFNLGSIKFYYNGPFTKMVDEKEVTTQVKACAFIGYEHPNNVWQDKIDMSQDQCHRTDMSQTNEDDIVTSWIATEGEGEAAKTMVNVRITHLKKKESHIDKFEDKLGLFKEKEYLTTSFIRYKIENLVPGPNDLEFGMKGLIYTRSPTANQGSFYFFEHEDHDHDKELGQQPVKDHFKATQVTIPLTENKKATWMDCTFNRELEKSGKRLVIKCYVNV
jgi:hypothetical protein